MSAPNASTADNLKKLGSVFGLLAIPVAVAAGAYYFFQNAQQESGHRYPSPPRSRTPPRRGRRWSRSRSPSPESASSPTTRSSSPERHDPRGLSPAPHSHEAPEAQPSASTAQSANRRVRETDKCVICGLVMSQNRTISLNCGHDFHDECYTVWRYVVVKHNPLAKLCPSCENVPESS